MDEIGSCWHADHSSRWRLIAEVTEEGWVAIVFNRDEKRSAYREKALDENDAKAKAAAFLVGIAPPITFHKGTSIELHWTRCTERAHDSE